MICSPCPLARLPTVALAKKSKKPAASNPHPLAASAPIVKLRVAHPRVAVVPVAHAADLLGQ